MSFQSRNGTYGGRQPRGWLMRWFNRQAVKRIKRRGGRMRGMNLLVLTAVGKKSGGLRETPLAWFPGPDGSWLVVASAAGAKDNPAWYYNIAAYPNQVAVTYGGDAIAVAAQQLHGDERAVAWRTVLEHAPSYANYLKKTDRELPIIRLTRGAA
jgi:deazaflavin-dependent oxidoreductase (nitroreductase family)